jgi:hypothetical protein
LVNSLTKLDCPVCQTGLFGFGSSNSAATFVKFQNLLFNPPPGDIKGLSGSNPSITCAPYDLRGQTGFCHLSAPSVSPVDPGHRAKPPVKRVRGLPTMDKYCPLRASRNGGLRHLARRDLAAATHAHMNVFTRVWNPSHHSLTYQLDQVHTPKHSMSLHRRRPMERPT